MTRLERCELWQAFGAPKPYESGDTERVSFAQFCARPEPYSPSSICSPGTFHNLRMRSRKQKGKTKIAAIFANSELENPNSKPIDIKSKFPNHFRTL